MKKIISALLALLLVFSLAACGEEAVVPESPKTISEVTTKFEYSTGKALIDSAVAEYVVFNRGDEVSILNEDENYYYINYEHITLSIPKVYLRKSSETDPSAYKVYAKSNAGLYSDGYLKNKIQSLAQNTELTVLDVFGDYAYVQLGEKTAYAKLSELSTSKIQNRGTTPTTPTQPGGSDGEDISLASFGTQKTVFVFADNGSENAKVLADGIKGAIAFFKRGDVVKVLGSDGDNYEVLISGHKALVPKKFVRMDTESNPESFVVYTKSGTGAFKDYELKEKVANFGFNGTVTVIDEVDGIYVLQLEDGSAAYMDKGLTSESRMSAPVVTPSTPEWTDPVL